MASRILLACAALQFPQYRVRPTMLQFIELLRRSTSWRVRLDVLLPLQGEYSFSNLTRSSLRELTLREGKISLLLPPPLLPRRRPRLSARRPAVRPLARPQDRSPRSGRVDPVGDHPVFAAEFDQLAHQPVHESVEDDQDPEAEGCAGERGCWVSGSAGGGSCVSLSPSFLSADPRSLTYAHTHAPAPTPSRQTRPCSASLPSSKRSLTKSHPSSRPS